MFLLQAAAAVGLWLVEASMVQVPDANGRPLVNINTALAEELMKLPRIGPARAKAIIAERRNSAFRTVDELIRVPGIGPGTLAQLRPLITAGNSTAAAPTTRRWSPAEVLESFQRLKYPDQQRLILRLLEEGMGAQGRDWLRRRLCGATPRCAGQINLNTANPEDLSRIPEISQEMVELIIKSRPPGGYQSVGDLIFLEGMTKELILKIRHLVTVQSVPVAHGKGDHDEGQSRIPDGD